MKLGHLDFYCSVLHLLAICRRSGQRRPGRLALVRSSSTFFVHAKGWGCSLQVQRLRFQILHGIDESATELLLGQRAEESVGQIQKRHAGRRKAQENALPPFNPVRDTGSLVGCIFQPNSGTLRRLGGTGTGNFNRTTRQHDKRLPADTDVPCHVPLHDGRAQEPQRVEERQA